MDEDGISILQSKRGREDGGESGDDDDWDDIRGYMAIKRRKLHNQLTNVGKQQSHLFSGIVIYVNGYTDPDADALKELIHIHGGGYEYSLSSRVSHVIASNLPTAKIVKLSESTMVCTPQWITDSISANRLLPVKDYELYSTLSKGQKQLRVKADEKIDSSPMKDFVDTFFNHSRLHHLSKWSSELKEFTSQLISKTTPKLPLVPFTESIRNSKTRAVCHVDIDCFFVSVSIRDKPHLKGKPIAVSHSKSLAKESTSDVSSCSYEARGYGIRNGMSVGQALNRYPDLIIVPYDFDKYYQVSLSLYETIIKYSGVVQAVSCDEMYVEFTDYCRDFNQVQDIVRQMRDEIREKTGCNASVGISHNMLLARLATKKAKPNGQFYLAAEEVKDYLAHFPVGSLPGVGRSLTAQLDSKGITTCGQLSNVPLFELQGDFGEKTGEMLCNFSQGIDKRELVMQTNRKSMSVDVNYGLRFSHLKEAEDLVKQLSQELHTRAIEGGNFQGTSVCLKMKIRKPDAPLETWKYMGHGSCHNVSRSHQLENVTNSSEDIESVAKKMLHELAPVASDIRGMGIQLVMKLKESSVHNQDIRKHMIERQPDRVSRDKISPSLIETPPLSQLDQSVLLELPPEIQEKIFESYSGQEKADIAHVETVDCCDVKTLLIDCHPDVYMNNMRSDIRSWVMENPDGPPHDEVKQFEEFIVQLTLENLEIATLTLKCLKRSIISGNSKWAEVFEVILSTVESEIHEKYGLRGKLLFD
jgi:DNA repair protein REV1